MNEIRLEGPLSKKDLQKLKAGDEILYTGKLLTARDAAHKKMIETLQKGEALPLSLQNEIIYYVGPCPPKEGEVIGAAGPTTSIRMDGYTKPLLDEGLMATIGKGKRSETLKEAMIKVGAVYFLAIGGLGALLAERIKSAKIIAYPELGTEAVRELWVVDFPLVVGIDVEGRDLLMRNAGENHGI